MGVLSLEEVVDGHGVVAGHRGVVLPVVLKIAFLDVV